MFYFLLQTGTNRKNFHRLGHFLYLQFAILRPNGYYMEKTITASHTREILPFRSSVNENISRTVDSSRGSSSRKSGTFHRSSRCCIPVQSWYIRSSRC